MILSIRVLLLFPLTNSFTTTETQSCSWFKSGIATIIMQVFGNDVSNYVAETTALLASSGYCSSFLCAVILGRLAVCKRKLYAKTDLRNAA
ncbi:hypothetical protein BaRGS_00010642 [Batillaria attramentaria]|uniref:Uncharacterized protein n=1 Tax=Batillaria attramentaria TaxID=370345 RepID=A0ABD0LGH3_9CAEN